MESAGEPVVRRHRQDRRRGSIKSRIVELSKRRKKEPPDKARRGEEDRVVGGGGVRDNIRQPEITDVKPPVVRRYNTRAPVISLRDPGLAGDDGQSNSNGVGRSELDKIQVASELGGGGGPPARLRPSELVIGERRGGDCDYSFMSSCSLPSENTTPSSPSLPHERVVFRHSDRNNLQARQSGQAGRLLNSALARHFRRLHCGGGGEVAAASDDSAGLLSDNLYQYIKDVFSQLDSQHTGTVSRQDFQALCEILGLDQSPAHLGGGGGGGGGGGLQWLPSYQPRPGTPASPIRLDRISEAELRSGGQTSQHHQPPPTTSFLWTLGPRPFWELWPSKKHKKKKLNLDEFIQSLLELWAATHHFPPHLAVQIINTKHQTRPAKAGTDKSVRQGPSHVHYQDDTQFDRLRRSVVRGLTRRAHKHRRLNRNGVACHPVSQTSRPGLNGHSMNGSNGTGHYNFPRAHSSLKSRLWRPLGLGSARKVEKLEAAVAAQQEEIKSLKDCVDHLRGSLQLSDAQNLALQVLLKKMSKAESKLPQAEKSEFRSEMKKSEQQLENLVSELKELSQTKYPTIPSNIYSGSVLSFNAHSRQGAEDELEDVHQSISGVRRDLTATQKNLQRISRTLEPGLDCQGNTMMEAYEALLKTEREIDALRSSLSSTLTSLELAQNDFVHSQVELKQAKDSLSQTTQHLLESEQKIDCLNENRKSLLHEIKATKDVLMSSLKNVQHLELESRKVPELEARIDDLEKLLPAERPGKISFLDESFVIYTESESEVEVEAELLRGLPPRPPSTRGDKDKSFNSGSPEMFSPTPSSGHFSAGSGLSKSPGEAGTSLVHRLRREIDGLKSKMTEAERDWEEERQRLLAQDLRQERLRLAVIEQKIKEILSVLKSLNSMKISQRRMGSMVVAAVEEAYDSQKGEVDVYKFLTILYSKSRDHERRAADTILSDALLAITEDHSDSDSDTTDLPSFPARQSDLYRIDV